MVSRQMLRTETVKECVREWQREGYIEDVLWSMKELHANHRDER